MFFVYPKTCPVVEPSALNVTELEITVFAPISGMLRLSQKICAPILAHCAAYLNPPSANRLRGRPHSLRVDLHYRYITHVIGAISMVFWDSSEDEQQDSHRTQTVLPYPVCPLCPVSFELSLVHSPDVTPSYLISFECNAWPD